MEPIFSTPPNRYEEELIEIMYYQKKTLRESLFIDMRGKEVNISSVYDIVDYLEQKLEDLDKVQYYMQVFKGQLPDVGLKKIEKE